MGDYGLEVLACIDVLPTGPIRISYNKFRYYAENRHLLHQSLTVLTISLQSTHSIGQTTNNVNEKSLENCSSLLVADSSLLLVIG